MNAPLQKTLVFRVERYEDIETELVAIYPEHYEELAVNKHRKRLNPDYETYHAMARMGVLHIPTARDAVTGELVGYFIFIIRQNVHYKDIRTAYNDIFFLRKAYRRGHNGLRFVRFVLDSMKARGVDEVYCGTKLHNDFGPIFERFGFAPIERIYTKLLDGSKNESEA